MPLCASCDHEGVLFLEGSDASKFLHGQCTQDVLGKRPFQGGYAFVLDARGRNVGDLRFLVRDHDVVVFVAAGRAAALRTWLDRFVVAADVRIVDASRSWRGLHVTGSGAAAMIASLLSHPIPPTEDAATKASFGAAELIVVADHSFGPEGCVLWATGDDAARTIAAAEGALLRAGCDRATEGALEALRIAAFRPRFGVDIDETTLPAESGQEARAVSFTKGCYAGQEVVAKQKYLGKPRKMLALVEPERSVAVPAPLFVPGSRELAGTLTSCALDAAHDAIGLAMLKAPLPPPGAVLHAHGDVPVVVAEPPLTSA